MSNWQDPKTAIKSGEEILLKTATGVVSAYFLDEDNGNPEGDGFLGWICYDDKFEIPTDGHDGLFSGFIGWMAIPHDCDEPK